MALGAQANMVSLGVREIRVQGMIDATVDLNFQLEVGYGYFYRDFVQFGGLVGLTSTGGGDDTLIRGMCFLEKTMEIDNLYWMPYYGGAAGLFGRDMLNGTSAGVELMGYGGMKYYWQDNLALGIEGRVTLASDDIYRSDDDEYDMVDWAILISTRCFY
jgi:hypothetical protein